jgi:cleavage and polyadenylation specificity factor subunit 3
MLEEHWSRHPDLHHIKVYQASGVARKALSVFQTYVGMMNSAIQEAVQVSQEFYYYFYYMYCIDIILYYYLYLKR